MRTGHFRTHFIAATFLVMAVGTVNAGNLSFLRNSPMASFNDEDVRLMMANAEAAVLDTKLRSPRTWENPATKHTGTAETLLSYSGPNGIACKRLRIANQAGSNKGRATFTVCNRDEKGWQLVPSDFAPVPKAAPAKVG
jgi:hypothetical protein